MYVPIHFNAKPYRALWDKMKQNTGKSSNVDIAKLQNINGGRLWYRLYHNSTNLFSKLSENTFHKEISKF